MLVHKPKRKIKIAPSNQQLLTYDVIVAYMTEHLYSPTVREICAIRGKKSTSTILKHLEGLKAWGLIDYLPTQPRTIRIKGYKLVRD